jgi:hypothetical protein
MQRKKPRPEKTVKGMSVMMEVARLLTSKQKEGWRDRGYIDSIDCSDKRKSIPDKTMVWRE